MINVSGLCCFDCRFWCGRCSKFKGGRFASDKACGDVDPLNKTVEVFVRQDALIRAVKVLAIIAGPC